MTAKLYPFEHLNHARDLAAQMQREAVASQTLCQNLADALSLRCDLPDPRQAAYDLLTGIEVFYAQYETAQPKTPAAILDEGLEQLLHDLPADEQTELLHALLAANAAQCGAAQPDAPDADPQQLRRAVVDRFCRYSLPTALDHWEEIPTPLLRDSAYAPMMAKLKDAETTAYTALALYVLQLRGELPGQDTPAAVGAVTAATAEAFAAMLQQQDEAAERKHRLQVIAATLAVVLITVLAVAGTAALCQMLRSEFIDLYGKARGAYLFPTIPVCSGFVLMALMIWYFTAGDLIEQYDLVNEWASGWRRLCARLDEWLEADSADLCGGSDADIDNDDWLYYF